MKEPKKLSTRRPLSIDLFVLQNSYLGLSEKNVGGRSHVVEILEKNMKTALLLL